MRISTILGSARHRKQSNLCPVIHMIPNSIARRDQKPIRSRFVRFGIAFRYGVDRGKGNTLRTAGFRSTSSMVGIHYIQADAFSQRPVRYAETTRSKWPASWCTPFRARYRFLKCNPQHSISWLSSEVMDARSRNASSANPSQN